MDTVESTADEGAVEISSLSSPSELKRRIPRSEAAERVVRASRRTIVLRQVRAGESRIAGILLESNLRPGKQDWRRRDALEYGVSITDACIGWEETERLLYEAAGHAA